MDIAPSDVAVLAPKIHKAFADMVAVEAGAIANPDEGRMVGHYWLRNADLAPNEQLKKAIVGPIAALKAFAEKIHNGTVQPPSGGCFEQVLLIGIGGSALGPQLVSEAIGQNARLPLAFFDNTDPAGMDSVLAKLSKIGLAKTLVLVISKSGGTAETRNGMLEAKVLTKPQDSTLVITLSPSLASDPSWIIMRLKNNFLLVSRWKIGSVDGRRFYPPSALCLLRYKA